MNTELFMLALVATILAGSLTGSTWKLPTAALGVVLTLTYELGWILEMMP